MLNQISRYLSFFLFIIFFILISSWLKFLEFFNRKKTRGIKLRVFTVHVNSDYKASTINEKGGRRVIYL